MYLVDEGVWFFEGGLQGFEAFDVIAYRHFGAWEIILDWTVVAWLSRHDWIKGKFIEEIYGNI